MGPVVKRIDNYGPPNAKSPFSQGDDKADSKPETTTDETIIKKNESQSADENVQHAESLGKILDNSKDFFPLENDDIQLKLYSKM